MNAATAERWEGLQSELRPFVARRVAPADVDDVLQEVLLRVHRGVRGLADDTAFGPWVARVARSAVVDHHRARGRRQRLTEAARGEPTLEPAPATDDQAARELAAWTAMVVDALPEPYREAVRLADLEGLTQREIADRLGLSPSGARTRVQRGRARLRKLVEECCEVTLDTRGHVVSYQPRDGSCRCDERGGA